MSAHAKGGRNQRHGSDSLRIGLVLILVLVSACLGLAVMALQSKPPSVFPSDTSRSWAVKQEILKELDGQSEVSSTDVGQALHIDEIERQLTEHITSMSQTLEGQLSEELSAGASSEAFQKVLDQAQISMLTSEKDLADALSDYQLSIAEQAGSIVLFEVLDLSGTTIGVLSEGEGWVELCIAQQQNDDSACTRTSLIRWVRSEQSV